MSCKVFARVLSHYPYVVLLVVLVVVATCLIITLTVGPALHFDEPLAGFDPRGTVIGKRLVAYENLLNNPDGNANLLPFVHQHDSQEPDFLLEIPPDVRQNENNDDDIIVDDDDGGGHGGDDDVDDEPPPSSSSLRDDVYSEKSSQSPRRRQSIRYKRRKKLVAKAGGKRGKPRSSTNKKKNNSKKNNNNNNNNKNASTTDELLELCGVPDHNYARIIVTSSHHSSLFNVEDLLSMCELELQVFQRNPAFVNTCARRRSDVICCPAWSLANYVALLKGRGSCREITATDVKDVELLLARCAPYFKDSSLEPNCGSRVDDWYHSPQFASSSCDGVPNPCKKYNAVYNIFHYLTTASFSSSVADFYSSSSTSSSSSSSTSSTSFSSSSIPPLQYSSMFLPVVAGSRSIDVFEHLNEESRTFNGIKVVAANFGIKYLLFEKYLLLDSVWLAAAGLVIFLAMWLYCTSIVVTVMTFLSMFWAVEVGYFVYTFIFKIRFFPYMNMVTLVVMIGIGADDLFIYCKIWHLAKGEKNNGMMYKIVSDTLSHTSLSMMVTSLTTAAAFFAGYVSDIPAIQCFSVYAGTCIIINLILTVTWLPASVMLYEKYCRCCVGTSPGNLTLSNCFCKLPCKIYYSLCELSRTVFEKVIPCLVLKFRYVWIIVFGGLWLVSILVIFYNPRLKLPSSRKFQVFTSDHLLELYDFEYGEQFEFERVKEEDLPMFPITVVWGVIPEDDGDPLNPHDKGSLKLDPNFDITTPTAQRWILDFCAQLRRTDFYKSVPGIHLTNCFFENFVHRFMKQSCSKENTECCKQTEFPFHPATLISCLSVYIPSLRKTPFANYNPQSPGPRFHNGRISAFFIQFMSNYTFTQNYDEADAFYRKVNRWVNDQIVKAPLEMRRGWFVSYLSFYDLQWSLALGTPLALGISLTVVSFVSFFTTLNVLISVYAILSVTATISVTLAALVLMGWELNILESVVITVAIGLAVDLTLHYGVAYRLAPDIGREMRVITSLRRMGSPVTMATFTSLSAGAFMMPSTVLVYRKFGVFLLILISTAWIYATFFFQSLLRVVGPNSKFGQFHWPASDCCSPGSRDHVDKTIYTLSESTLSSSSTSTRDNSHGGYGYTQELEPLTERSRQQKHFRYPYGHGHDNSVSNKSNRTSRSDDEDNDDNDEELDDENAAQQSSSAHHHHHHHHHYHHHHHHHRSRRKGGAGAGGARYAPIQLIQQTNVETVDINSSSGGGGGSDIVAHRQNHSSAINTNTTAIRDKDTIRKKSATVSSTTTNQRTPHQQQQQQSNQTQDHSAESNVDHNSSSVVIGESGVMTGSGGNSNSENGQANGDTLRTENGCHQTHNIEIIVHPPPNLPVM